MNIIKLIKYKIVVMIKGRSLSFRKETKAVMISLYGKKNKKKSLTFFTLYFLLD